MSTTPTCKELRQGQRFISSLKNNPTSLLSRDGELLKELRSSLKRIEDMIGLPDSFWEGKTKVEFFDIFKQELASQEERIKAFEHVPGSTNKTMDWLRTCATKSCSAINPTISESDLKELSTRVIDSALHVARNQASLDSLRSQLIEASAFVNRFLP